MRELQERRKRGNWACWSSVLDNAGISAEVFNISRVRARIQCAMDGLSAPATCSCQRCGCATGSVSIVTLDADEAYEACSASAVLQAWGRYLSMSFRNALDPALFWLSVGRKKSHHSQVASSLGGGRSAWMWSGKRFVPSPGCRWFVWQDRCMSSKGFRLVES